MAPHRDDNGNGIGKRDLIKYIVIILINLLVAAILAILNASYISGQYSARFTQLEKTQAEDHATIYQMNTNGTVFSQNLSRSDFKTENQILSRLTNLEQQISRLPVMDATLLRLEADIKEVKNRPTK